LALQITLRPDAALVRSWLERRGFNQTSSVVT
jgi:hypothetical protein